MVYFCHNLWCRQEAHLRSAVRPRYSIKAVTTKITLKVNQQTLYKQLQTEREKAEKEHNELRKQLENVQSTLQQQQRERREEEVHHKEMWMELQSLLAREQGSKEDLALKICTEWIIPGRQ
ncbi:GRIP and coiled-coil domain-containing protein 1-like isoform X3 [Dysidea avara]|uniref:GRIP and coiled-coil domain-containing protein 1-like isoform X3 n=1 Tax=Dysidea avara TaxID=196820 RepID=UPI0033251ABE